MVSSNRPFPNPKARHSAPGWFLVLFEMRGVNPDWLKQGKGPIYLRTEDGRYMEPEPAATPLGRGVSLPYYDSDRVQDGVWEPSGTIMLPEPYAGKELRILRITGDSFSPTVRQGAFVASIPPASGLPAAASSRCPCLLKASSSSGCFVTVTRSCSVRTIRSTLRCPFRLLKPDGSSAGSLGFFKRSEPAEAGLIPCSSRNGGGFLGARLGLSAHSGVTCAARTAKIHGKL